MSNATQQPKERPILFSAPMVRAILENRKTQTRRIVKPQPDAFVGRAPYKLTPKSPTPNGSVWMEDDGKCYEPIKCPYGYPGDQLWVRETWARDESGDYLYRADAIEDDSEEIGGNWVWEKHFPGPWRPSIHMPRAASRILLEITDIRAERVCDISEADAIAEGIEVTPIWKGPGDVYPCDPIHEYSRLWQSINGPESWNINPWVWVITFNRITP